MTTGIFLGKFMPPHAGHVYAVEMARAMVSNLVVLVDPANEEIDANMRTAWMQEISASTAIRLPRGLPQSPESFDGGEKEFWRIWRKAVIDAVGMRPHYVFASEEYGKRLASELGATFVPIDVGRTVRPVSATAVRSNMRNRWADLPRCVKPTFSKRVVTFGPESCGKTTLARDLAEELGTNWVPEYARSYLTTIARPPVLSDIPIIALGQTASAAAIARDSACQVLSCDTDATLTCVWSNHLFGSVPEETRMLASRNRADLYVLVTPEVKWVADEVRTNAGTRERFYEECVEALRDLPHVIVRGGRMERVRQVTNKMSEIGLW